MTGSLGLLLTVLSLQAAERQDLLTRAGDHCARTADAPAVRYEFAHPAMGTTFRIVLYGTDPERASSAADEAFERIDEIEGTLSDYDPHSELSRLSHSAGSGDWVQVSDDLWAVVSLAQAWSVRTGGAFDITVGPLTRLWRWANRRGQNMPLDRAAEAMNAVGYEKLQMDPESRALRLTVLGMRLDAGGVGKGFAADEALHVLRSRGFGRALLDAGGDLRLGDAPPDGRGWKIGLPALDSNRQPTSMSKLANNTAVATSGDQYRHTTDRTGVRRSHVLDPRTGHSTTSGRIVTVAAVRAAVADILASAASVMTATELKALDYNKTQAGLIRILEPSPDGEGWDLKLYKPRRAS